MSELEINIHAKSIVGQFLDLLSKTCKKDKTKYIENRNYYVCAMMNQFTSKYESEYVDKGLMSQEDYKKLYSIISDIFFWVDVEPLKKLFDEGLEQTRYAVKFLGLMLQK